MWFPRVLLILALWLLSGVSNAQPPEEETKPEGRQFFSGLVTDLGSGKLTVGRTLPGEPAESRSFLLTPATKVDGKLRRNVRVTVQYAAGDQGEVAVHIVVRPDVKKDGKT